MSYNLFLDDIRYPDNAANYILPVELKAQYRVEQWDIIRSYESFVSHIEKYGLPNKISFDHDLADEHYVTEGWENAEYKEKTGLDCAKWLLAYCINNDQKLPIFFCHSMNPIGKERILSLLQSYKNHEDNSSR